MLDYFSAMRSALYSAVSGMGFTLCWLFSWLEGVISGVLVGLSGQHITAAQSMFVGNSEVDILKV